MSKVQIKGLLEFNSEVLGVRVVTTEQQKLYDIDKDILIPEAQQKLPNASFPKIPLVAVGDKLVSKEEQGVLQTIATVEARLNIVLEVERILLGVHQQTSNPQPLLRNEQPTHPKKEPLIEFMVTIETKEYDPILKEFKPLQLTGSFHTPTKDEAKRQARFYYAQELGTTKDNITIVHVDTVQEHKERQAKQTLIDSAKPYQEAPLADRYGKARAVEQDKLTGSNSTQRAETNKAIQGEKEPKAPKKPKADSKEKAKAEPKAKTKTKLYTILLSVKTMTPDEQGIEDREIKRDFEDVNVTNAKMKAREAVAQEYNVPMKDVKVLKAGVKK